MSQSHQEPDLEEVADTDPFGETVPVDPAKDPWDRFVNLRAVARTQRHMLYWIGLALTGLVAGVLFLALGIVPIPVAMVPFFFWGVTIVTAVLVGRLNWAMGENACLTAFAVLFTLIPIINVNNVLFANSAASSRLRDAGVPVGLLGASDDSVIRATSPWCCNHCGYDLTGNTSGRCPECGRPLSEEARSAIVRRAADLARDAGMA